MASAASTVFVQQVYNTLLLRNASATETNFWATLIDGTPPAPGLSLGTVVANLINSNLGNTEVQNFVVPIVLVFEDIFQQAPSAAQLNTYVNQYRGGTPLNTIEQTLAASSILTAGNLNAYAVVTDLYFTMLGRALDPAALPYWTSVGNAAEPVPNQNDFSQSPNGPVLHAIDAAGIAAIIDGIRGSAEYQGDLIGLSGIAPQLNWNAAANGWLAQAALADGNAALAAGATVTPFYATGVIAGLPGSTIYATSGEAIVLTTSGAIINGQAVTGPIITSIAPGAIFSGVISQDAGAQVGPTTLLVNDVLVGNGVTTLDVVLESGPGSSSSSSDFFDFDSFTFDGPSLSGVDYKDWATITGIPNIILISDGFYTNYWNAGFGGVSSYTDLNSDTSLVLYNLQSTAISFTVQNVIQAGIAFAMVFADSALSAAGNNRVSLNLNTVGVGFVGYGSTEDGSGPGLTAGVSIFMNDTSRTHLGVNIVDLNVVGDNYIDTFYVGDNQFNGTLKTLNISGPGNLWVGDQIPADTGSNLLTVNLSPYGGLGSHDSRNSTGNVLLPLGAEIGASTESSDDEGNNSQTVTQGQGVSGFGNYVTQFANSTSPVIHFIGGNGPGTDTILLGDPANVVGGIGFKQDTIQGNGGPVTVQLDISQGDQAISLGVNGSFKIFTGVNKLEVHPLKGDLSVSGEGGTPGHATGDISHLSVVNFAGYGGITEIGVDGDNWIGGYNDNDITFNQATSALTTLTLSAFAATDSAGSAAGNIYSGFSGPNFATITINSTSFNANGLDVVVAPSNNQGSSIFVNQLVTPGIATLTFDNQSDLNGFAGFGVAQTVTFNDILDTSLTTANINSSTAPLVLIFDSNDILLQTINVSPNVGPGQQVAVAYSPVITPALHVNGNGGNFEFFGAIAGYNGVLNINNTQAVMLNPLGAVSTINASTMTGDVLLDFAGNLDTSIGTASGVNVNHVASSLSIGFGDLNNGLGPNDDLHPFAANIAMTNPGSTLNTELDNTGGFVNVALTTTNVTSLIVTTGNLAPGFIDLGNGTTVTNAPENFGGATFDLSNAAGVTSVTILGADAQNGIELGDFATVIGTQDGGTNTVNNPVASTILTVDAGGFGDWIDVNMKNAVLAGGIDHVTVTGGQKIGGGFNWVITAANAPTTVNLPNFSDGDRINTDGNGNMLDPLPGTVTANLFVTSTQTLDQTGSSSGHALANITTENIFISGSASPGGNGPVSLVLEGAADWRDDVGLVEQNLVNTLTTINVFGGFFNSAVQAWDPSGALGGLNFNTYNAALFQGTSSLLLEDNSFNHTYIGGLGVGGFGPNTLYEILTDSVNNLGTYTPTVQNFQQIVLDIQGEPDSGSPPADTVNLATATGVLLVELLNEEEQGQTMTSAGYYAVNVVLPNAGGTVVQLGDSGALNPASADGSTFFPSDIFDDSFSSSSGLPSNLTPGDFANIIVPNGTQQLTVNLAHTNYHSGEVAPATLDINNQAGTLGTANPLPALNIVMVNDRSQQLLLASGGPSGNLPVTTVNSGAPVTTINVSGGDVYNSEGSQILDLMAANFLGTEPGTQYLPLHTATTSLNAFNGPNGPYFGSVWVDVANDPPGPFTFHSGYGGQDWFIGTGTGFGGSPGFDDVVIIENYQAAGGGNAGGIATPGTGTTVWGGKAGVELTLKVLTNDNIFVGEHGVLTNINNITVNMGFNSSLQYFDPSDLGGKLLQTLTVTGGNPGSLFAIYDYGNNSDENVGTGFNVNRHDPQDAPGLFATGQFGLGGPVFHSFDAHTYEGTTWIVGAPDSWIATAAGVGAETMIGGQGTGGIFLTIADNNGGGYYGTLSAALFGNFQTVVLDSFDLSPIASSNTFFLPTAAAGLQTVVVMGTAPATLPNFNAAWTLQLGDGAGAFELPSGFSVPHPVLFGDPDNDNDDDTGEGSFDGLAWISQNNTPPSGSAQTEGPGGNQLNVTLVGGTTANIIIDNTNTSGGSGGPGGPATLNIINATVANILVPNSSFQTALLTGTPAASVYIAGGSDTEAAFLDLSNGLTSPLNAATTLLDALHPPTTTFAGNVPFVGPYSGGVAADFASANSAVTVFTGLSQDNQFIGSKFADTFNITNFVDFFGGVGNNAGTYIKAGTGGATDNLNVPFNSNVQILGQLGPGLINETKINFNIGPESTLKFGSDIQGDQQGAADLNDPMLQTVKVLGGDFAEDSAFIVSGYATAAGFSGSVIGQGGVTNGAFWGPGFQSVDFSGFKGFVSVVLGNDSTIAGHSYIGSTTPTLLFEILDWVGSGVYGGTLNPNGTWTNSTVFKDITTLVIDNFEVAGGNDAFGPNKFDASGFNNVGTLALTGSVYSQSGVGFTAGPNGSGIFGNPNPALNNTTPINITNFPGGVNGTVLQLGYDQQGDLGITDQSFSGLIVANVTLNPATANGILKVLVEDTAKETLGAVGSGSPPSGGPAGGPGGPGVGPAAPMPLLTPTTALGGSNDTDFSHFADFLAPGVLNPTNAGEVDLTINNGNIQSMLLSGSETIVKVNGDPLGVFLPNDGFPVPPFFGAFVLNLTGLSGYLPGGLVPNGTANIVLPKTASGQSSSISGNITTFTAFTIDPAHQFDPLYGDLATSTNSFAGDIAVSFVAAKSKVTAVLGYGDGNIVFGSAYGDTVTPSFKAAAGGFRDNFTLPNFDNNSWVFAGPSGADETLYVLSGNDDLLNNLPKGKVSINNTNLTNATTQTYVLGNDVTLAFNGSQDLGGIDTNTANGVPVTIFSPWSHLTNITIDGGNAPSNGTPINAPTAGSYFVVNGNGQANPFAANGGTAYAGAGSFVGDVPLPNSDGSGLFAKFDGSGGVNSATSHVVTQIVVANNALENSRILSVIGPNPINPAGNNTVVTAQQTYIGGNGNLPVVLLGSAAAPNPLGLFGRNELVITFDTNDENQNHGDTSNVTNAVDPILTNWNDVLYFADDTRIASNGPPPVFFGTTINEINFNNIGDYIVDGYGNLTLVNDNAPIVLGGQVTFNDPTTYGTTFSGNLAVNLSSAFSALTNQSLNVTLVDSFGNSGANGTAGVSPSLSSDGTVSQINFIVPTKLAPAAGGPPNFGGVSNSSGAGGYQDLNLGGLVLDLVDPLPNHGFNTGFPGGTVNVIKLTVVGGPPVTNPSFYPAGPTGGLYPTTPSKWVVDFTGSNQVGNPGNFASLEHAFFLDVLQQATAVVDASGFTGALGVDAFAFNGNNGNTNGGVTLTGGQGIGNSFVGSRFNDVINDPNFTTLTYIDGDPVQALNKDKEIANLFVQSVQTFTVQNVFGITALNFIFGPGLPDPNNPGVLIPVTVVDHVSGNLNAPPPADLRTITVSNGTAGSYFIWNGVQSTTPTTVNSFDAQHGTVQSGNPALPEGPFLGNVQLELGGGEATGGGLINGNTFIGGSNNNNVLVVEATNLLDTHYYNGKVGFFQQVDFVTYDNGNVFDTPTLGTGQRFMGLNAGGFQASGAGVVGAINVANGTTTGPTVVHYANVAITNFPNLAGPPSTPIHVGIGDKLVFDNITEPPTNPIDAALYGSGDGPDPFSPPNPSGVEFNEGYQFWPNPTFTTDPYFGGQYLVVNLNATGATFLPASLSIDLNNEGWFEPTSAISTSSHPIHFTGDGALTGVAPQPFLIHGGGASGLLNVAKAGVTLQNGDASVNGSAAITILTNGVSNFIFTVPTNDLAIVNGALPPVSPTTLQDFDIAIGLDNKASPPIAAGSMTFTGGQTGGVVYIDHQSDTTNGDSAFNAGTGIQSGIPNYITLLDASKLVSDLIMAPDARVNIAGGGAFTFTGYNQSTVGVVGGFDTVEHAKITDILTGNANSISNNWLIANHDSTNGDQYDLGNAVNESLVFNGSPTTGVVKNFGLLDLSFLTNQLNTGASGTTATVGAAGSTLGNPLGGTSTKGNTIIDSHYNDVVNFSAGATFTGADTNAFDGNVYTAFKYTPDHLSPNLFFNSNSGTAYTHINNFDIIRDAAVGPNAAKLDKVAIDLPYSTQTTATGATTLGTYDPAGSAVQFGATGDSAAKAASIIGGGTLDLTLAYGGGVGKTDVFVIGTDSPVYTPGNVADLDRVSTMLNYMANYKVNTGSVTARFIVLVADSINGAHDNDAFAVYEVTANGNGTTTFGTNAVDGMKVLGIATIDDVTHHLSAANWGGVVSSQPAFV